MHHYLMIFILMYSLFSIHNYNLKVDKNKYDIKIVDI